VEREGSEGACASDLARGTVVAKSDCRIVGSEGSEGSERRLGPGTVADGPCGMEFVKSAATCANKRTRQSWPWLSAASAARRSHLTTSRRSPRASSARAVSRAKTTSSESLESGNGVRCARVNVRLSCATSIEPPELRLSRGATLRRAEGIRRARSQPARDGEPFSSAHQRLRSSDRWRGRKKKQPYELSPPSSKTGQCACQVVRRPTCVAAEARSSEALKQAASYSRAIEMPSRRPCTNAG
jgi:hypothetical protein